MIFSTPYITLIALISLSKLSQAASPTLDLTNAQQLTSASSSALEVLQGYYSPNAVSTIHLAWLVKSCRIIEKSK